MTFPLVLASESDMEEYFTAQGKYELSGPSTGNNFRPLELSSALYKQLLDRESEEYRLVLRPSPDQPSVRASSPPVHVP